MQYKDNQSKRIYLKATRQWVDVSEEYYRDHTRYHDALRKRQQSHGQCVCPKNKFWLCDGDCLTCEFRRAGDMLSLDYTVENEDGVVVKHFCNISFEKFTMYVLLQMASSNHYTNGDGYDYTIRTHIS